MTHNNKEFFMSNTVDQIKQHFEDFLSEVAKLVKARRNEITEEKNARKEAKAA